MRTGNAKHGLAESLFMSALVCLSRPTALYTSFPSYTLIQLLILVRRPSSNGMTQE